MGSLEGRTKMINDPLRVGNEGEGQQENNQQGFQIYFLMVSSDYKNVFRKYIIC